MNFNKKNIQIIGVSVLGLILLFLLFGDSFKRRSPVSSGGGGGVDSVASIFADFDRNVRLLADKEIDDSLEEVMIEKLKEGWERNPFEILVSTEKVEEIIQEVSAGLDASAPRFTVSGIIFEEEKEDSYAVIDGEFYKIGEIVDEWGIIDIQRESVLFRKDEVEYIYNLYESES